ncbi:MAG: TIGR04053 family radical SAM/SPASM domain-containing protein, partial [Abditibacteriales bacterium]|nr:TIGR04053 family radical SAM/SPASM domain-containing protein [Abditibacteriales bacterium]MDW8366801.1 TIGR04053 family radical SAM/SPASM domain-containing protein [Abditibacteriales bacterium]
LDFNRSPFVVIWETTRACDLVCQHCRACAIPHRSPEELTTEEGFHLIDMVLEFADEGGRPPLFVLTGGDPMKRPDIYDFIAYGSGKGLSVAISPSATPLVTRAGILKMKACGLARMAISIDGPDAESHDAFRGVRGSFAHTMRMVEWSNEADLPLQIHTTISRYNRERLDDLGALMLSLRGVVIWSLFMLVPTGRGRAEDLVTAEDFEAVFNWLYDFSKRAPFDVRTTAAQHFRRVVLQRRAAERREGTARNDRERRDIAFTTRSDGIRRAPKGVNDGNGFVFIAHNGDICPSGFLPIVTGNVRQNHLVDVYRHAPVFQQLRNPDGFKGKCGYCEFRYVCGGSRARAYAMTGDYLESEPFCVYQPRREAATNPSAPLGMASLRSP